MMQFSFVFFFFPPGGVGAVFLEIYGGVCTAKGWLLGLIGETLF